MFKTAYGERKEKYPTPSGDPIIPIYEHRITKHGEKKLEKVGEKDIHAEIQTYEEETLISNIIARIMQGDTSMLHATGQYIDTTELPKTMIEAQQMMQDLQNYWKHLPLDIRREYGHSVEAFIADSGSEHWMQVMNLGKTEIPVAAPIKDIPKQPDITNTPISSTPTEKKGESEA